jgi:hypothetical protein
MTVGTIEDSRLKGGVLTLGGTSFAKQATSVQLVPSTETDGEPIETLSGATISAGETYTWALNIGMVQDFTDPAGLVEYLRSNAGTEVAYTWEPNADGPAYAGDVKVRPTTIGGEVAVRLSSEVELPVVGELADPVYPV